MKLHLVRHAKTEPNSSTGKDFDRKLMPKGIIQSNVLGTYLNDKEFKISHTYCSTALRTKETFAILTNFFDTGNVVFLDDLYLADREVYLKMIWKLKHSKDILVIGHNEGISEFAAYLSDTEVLMKTCEYMCIEFKASKWSEVSRGTGEITVDFRPMVYFPE